MEDNLKKIIDEFNEFKGQFVITDSWEIERLVAIGEDNIDYYWITYNGKDLKWYSCVGRIIPLKGFLRQKDYDYLIHIAKLNHYDQFDLQNNGNIDIFLKSLEDYISKNYRNEKILTDFCWNLN